MKELYYKGRRVTLWDKPLDKALEVREEGESWIDMRERTQGARDALERENKAVLLEFEAFLMKEISNV